MRHELPLRQQVLFGEQSYGAYSVATIELARPEALNALNEEMLRLIEERLREWEADPKVVCVFIHSENPKAFCAGGDVKGLAQDKLSGDIGKAKSFFTQEYYADFFVHQFKKPIVAWLDGICMGGGIGLTQGASHRIVTERTVMAMPEVFIGFFPDVGGSKFLSSLRSDLGLYLGLTGRKFSGSTAAAIGLVDFILPSASKRQVMADLARMPWSGNATDDRGRLSEYFSERSQLPANEFASVWPSLEKIFARGDFEEIVKVLEQERQAATGGAGRKPSLLSQAVFYRLVQVNKGRAWPAVFAQEWSTALRFCEDSGGVSGLGEFAEGVRALLIDKDGEAKWPERSIAEAWTESEACVRAYEPNLLALRMK